MRYSVIFIGTEASMKLIKAKCVEFYVLPNHASDNASFMDLEKRSA